MSQLLPGIYCLNSKKKYILISYLYAVSLLRRYSDTDYDGSQEFLKFKRAYLEEEPYFFSMNGCTVRCIPHD